MPFSWRQLFKHRSYHRFCHTGNSAKFYLEFTFFTVVVTSFRWIASGHSSSPITRRHRSICLSSVNVPSLLYAIPLTLYLSVFYTSLSPVFNSEHIAAKHILASHYSSEQHRIKFNYQRRPRLRRKKKRRLINAKAQNANAMRETRPLNNVSQ